MGTASSLRNDMPFNGDNSLTRATSLTPSSSDASDSGTDNGDSDPEPIEPVTCDTTISASNVGFKMMRKLGWMPGNGLGRRKQGRVDPIPIATKIDTLGLGKAAEYERVHLDSTARRRTMTAEVISRETDTEKERREARVEREMAIREQVKAMTQVFYCDLCDKRYANVGEWENHLASYGHNHQQRIRNMKENAKKMQMGENEAERRRRKREEQEAREIQRMLKVAKQRQSKEVKGGEVQSLSIRREEEETKQADNDGKGVQRGSPIAVENREAGPTVTVSTASNTTTDGGASAHHESPQARLDVQGTGGWKAVDNGPSSAPTCESVIPEAATDRCDGDMNKGMALGQAGFTTSSFSGFKAVTLSSIPPAASTAKPPHQKVSFGLTSNKSRRVGSSAGATATTGGKFKFTFNK
ncbi:hypothetical protein EV182_000250 [Spiromyces aspiralis]|uniref:Uncharacterized protein n=1 Tax=Spiromyces aspiralis TaxID=68401 RepID=A0ACC1HL04_9FUNG|nr:hypothetical protein EV182_000250 [Spiromyces aspiralis]